MASDELRRQRRLRRRAAGAGFATVARATGVGFAAASCAGFA